MNGQKIKFFRELRNYKREYLAEKLGIDASQLSRIENNQTESTVQRLLDIAKHLDVSVYDLLSDEELQQCGPKIYEKYGPIASAFVRHLLNQHELDTLKCAELQKTNSQLMNDLSNLSTQFSRLMNYIATQNETKRNETKRNETKRNETKRNETKRNEIKLDA